MRNFISLLTLAVLSSCGIDSPVVTPPADNLVSVIPPPTTWPDSPDLGVVVSSEVVALPDSPPPPDFSR